MPKFENPEHHLFQQTKCVKKTPFPGGDSRTHFFWGSIFGHFFGSNFWPIFDNFLTIFWKFWKFFWTQNFDPDFENFPTQKSRKKSDSILTRNFGSRFFGNFENPSSRFLIRFWKFDLPIFVQILKIRTSDFWSDLEKSGPPNFGQILKSDSRFDSRFWDPDLTWIRDMYPHAGYQIPLSSSKDASRTCFNLWFHLPKDASCACYQIPLSSSKDASHACFSLWFHLSKDVHHPRAHHSFLSWSQRTYAHLQI